MQPIIGQEQKEERELIEAPKLIEKFSDYPASSYSANTCIICDNFMRAM
jgi:hypothetical protein